MEFARPPAGAKAGEPVAPDSTPFETTEPEQRACPECQASNAAWRRLCQQCGSLLEPPESARKTRFFEIAGVERLLAPPQPAAKAPRRLPAPAPSGPDRQEPAAAASGGRTRTERQAKLQLLAPPAPAPKPSPAAKAPKPGRTAEPAPKPAPVTAQVPALKTSAPPPARQAPVLPPSTSPKSGARRSPLRLAAIVLAAAGLALAGYGWLQRGRPAPQTPVPEADARPAPAQPRPTQAVVQAQASALPSTSSAGFGGATNPGSQVGHHRGRPTLHGRAGETRGVVAGRTGHGAAADHRVHRHARRSSHHAPAHRCVHIGCQPAKTHLPPYPVGRPPWPGA